MADKPMSGNQSDKNKSTVHVDLIESAGLAFIILFLSMILGSLIPGYIAYDNQVFTKNTLCESKINELNKQNEIRNNLISLDSYYICTHPLQEYLFDSWMPYTNLPSSNTKIIRHNNASKNNDRKNVDAPKFMSDYLFKSYQLPIIFGNLFDDDRSAETDGYRNFTKYCRSCILIPDGNCPENSKESDKPESSKESGKSTVLENTVNIKKISIRPFNDSEWFYLWTFGYFTLLAFLVLLPRWSPRKKAEDVNNELKIPLVLGLYKSDDEIILAKRKYELICRYIRTIFFSLILYLSLRATNWYRTYTYLHRNGEELDEGRVVFAFTQFDICKECFSVFEFNWFVFCILIVIVWEQWSYYFRNFRERLRNEKNISYVSFEGAFEYKYIERLSKTYLEWQMASVLLAFAFIPFSKYYYHLYSLGDKRYLMDAVIVHGLWSVTWLFVSLPLIFTVYQWRSFRNQTLESLKAEAECINKDNYEMVLKQIETKLKILQEIHPVSFWNLVITSIASVVSLFLPLSQKLLS